MGHGFQASIVGFFEKTKGATEGFRAGEENNHHGALGRQIR